MNSLGIFVLLMAILFVPLGANMAFAQETDVINIPSGAASPEAPYFWQSVKDGGTNGEISIDISDSVNWRNGDTVAHTVTSGIAKEGQDGKFDSSLIQPGGSFIHKFTEAGDYPFFCLVHPWMTGVVKVSQVSSGVQVISNVGAKAGDGKTTFDVEYEYSRMIASATVDEKQKAITFEIVGKAKSEDHNLTLMLPKNLISDPLVIWADGKQITDFEISSKGGINNVIIPLNEKSERITIVGASVVPEFGAITMAILAIGILSFIALTFKVQKIIMPKL